mgnify:CR=1 FL=1
MPTKWNAGRMIVPFIFKQTKLQKRNLISELFIFLSVNSIVLLLFRLFPRKYKLLILANLDN